MSGGGGEGGVGLNWPIWAELLLAFLLVCLSAFFAGCTLGLLALDKVGLQIIASAGATEKERRNARKIIPLRDKGNWLLCTLLIGNTLANSFLSILLAGVTTGVLGLVISTGLIVIFAEIVPQSICCRYGLVIGAKLSLVIKFFMILLSPLSWPLAYILDKALGQEVGTVYSRQELKHLINIQVENPEHKHESGLTRDDQQLLAGALDYKEKRVSDVMTQLDKVYMLEATRRLNFDLMLQIYRSGYTRVPIYEGHKQNIVGILYTKDLILVDPDDELEIQTVISFHGKAHVQYILDITPLDEVFKLFKTGHKHLMVACRIKGSLPTHVTAQAGLPSNPDKSGSPKAVQTSASAQSHSNFLRGTQKDVTGVITLEDVLEEVIQDEIVDESDKFMTNEQKVQVNRKHGRGQRADDVDAYLKLFEHKRQPNGRLLAPEVAAISAFLVMTVKEFAIFQHADTVLKGLVKQATVLESGAADEKAVHERSGSQHGPIEPALYRRGDQTHYFSLVLQGRVQVRAGSEGFQSDLGAWTYLGTKALGLKPYTPDFHADMVATGPCRVLRIKNDAFRAALRMAKADEIMGARAMKQALAAQQHQITSAKSLPEPQAAKPLNANIKQSSVDLASSKTVMPETAPSEEVASVTLDMPQLDDLLKPQNAGQQQKDPQDRPVV